MAAACVAADQSVADPNGTATRAALRSSHTDLELESAREPGKMKTKTNSAPDAFTQVILVAQKSGGYYARLLPMASQVHCTVKHLADVFASCEEEIIAEWRLHAGQLLHERNLDKPTITNHLPELVAEITRDLLLCRDGILSAEHIRGSPPVHGVQRFHDGLDVGEVVAEYNLLRVAFITVADRHDLFLVGEAARIINLRIDDAVRLAAVAFAAQQALKRKEQEDEHLAFLAHDLRTPLNAVSLLVDALGQTLNEKARKRHRRPLRQAAA
jgi:signal transduction histidine kinase